MDKDITFFTALILLFTWISSSRDALTHLSGGRIRRIESKDRDLAKKAENWLENQHADETVFRFLGFIILSAIAGLSFHYLRTSQNMHSFYLPLALSCAVTVSVAIFAEILNEAFLAKLDLQLLKITMPLIRLLRYSVFLPFVFSIEYMRDKIEKRQSLEDDEERTTTEDEILSLVDQDVTEGEDASLEEDEKRMIRGVFDLDNTNVREIMTPRVDIIGIALTESPENAIKLFIKSGHSRIPVYEDNIDNIKGILYAKDFLNKSKLKDKPLMQIARHPIFVPETKEVGDLLTEIQKTRNHFAVVIDEYGGTAGIVTLEDIIEEIVGEIRDEFDINEDDTPMHKTMPDGSVIFDARTLICDVNSVMDSNISEEEDVDTIGGFVCGKLGHIPKPGEELQLENETIKIKVLQADRKHIIKLKITKDLEDK